MEGTSTFAQLDGRTTTGWRAHLTAVLGAVEGSAASVPLSLGCATLVFSRLGPDLVGSGVLATMLALAFIHLMTAGSTRPIFYSARTLEATTLAAMLDQLGPQLATWGLPDTAGVKLAFLCAIGAGTALLVSLLYLLRAQRLTPFIPAPVFAGFSNAIAVALLLSQSRALWHQMTSATAPAAVATIALVSVATAFAVRRWLPRRPAGAAGLAAGLLAGLLWAWLGSAPALVGGRPGAAMLPVLLADFPALLAPGVHVGPVVLLIVGNAAIMAAMVFINTAMAAQAMTQIDGQRSRRSGDGVIAGASMLPGGLAGAATISGSILVCLAVARTGPLRWSTVAFTALVVLAVYLSGLLAIIPLAAVVGVLLCEAWFLVDRPSVRLLADWGRGGKLPENAREDLALIVAVTALAVIANMVVAAFAGLVLGLFLFALRSARKPVRQVWTGLQLSSCCARGSAELRVLAQHGGALRVFELEGDMFFAVGASLDRSLSQHMEGARCAILDWSRVRHIDTSVATSVATFERISAERGLFIVHAGASLQHGNVRQELAGRIGSARLAPDLDYALELAENHLIQAHLASIPAESSAMFEVVPLFEGLGGEERVALEQAMTQRLYKRGEVILAAGTASDELMLILQGCASIVVDGTEGQPVRLAGVRRGAVIGEVGFLDGSPRSASVIAQEDVVVATLDRSSYDRLAQSHPPLLPKLVANIAVGLAARLRHTNRVALARARGH